MPAADNASSPRPWTVAETAEDLLARVEDALLDGFEAADIVSRLEAEGLDPHTARAVVAEVEAHKRVLPAGAAPAIESTLEITLAPVRTLLRGNSAPYDVDRAAADALVVALGRAGLSNATSSTLIAEVVAGERRMLELVTQRMRRLGVQGMFFGAATSLFFLYVAAVGGPAGAWNLLTATCTLSLTVYSWFLFRRGRPPNR